MSTLKVEEIQHPSNSNNAVSVASDSSVSLKHSGSAKLTTTSTGVSVTGTCSATAFSGDGSALTGISSGITVQDEGSALSTAATTLDFVGAGVTASGTGASKTITIPGGGLELVNSGTISTNTLSVSFDSTVLTADSRYLLHFFGITGSMSDLYIDATATNAAGTTTYGYGSQNWYNTITHGYGGTNGSQSSSVWRIYTHGYGSGDGTYCTMEFNTGTHPFISGHIMYADTNDGNSHFHGKIQNTVDDTKITGIRLRDQYGYQFRAGSHYKLYKFL